MRDFKGMKRQRGRNRNGGGGSGGGGSGGRPQHNANRAFDSNGPDSVKVRGAAQHVYERYQQLARDAHTAGDRVVAENYLQHAEHYFRVMRAMQPQRPIAEIVGRDQFVSGYDIDFEDEGSGGEPTEGDMEMEGSNDRSERFEARQGDRGDRFDPRQGDRARDERPRQDGPRQDAPRQDGPRQDASRAETPRDERPREFPNDRQQRNFRYDRPRFNRDERRDEATGRPERSEPGGPETAPDTRAEANSPRLAENGPERAAPVLRADDGEINHAPAFLQVRPVEPREGGVEGRRPRRRRPTRASENGDGAATTDTEDEGG